MEWSIGPDRGVESNRLHLAPTPLVDRLFRVPKNR